MRKFLQLLQSTKVKVIIILAVAFFLRIWQVSSVPPSPYWEEVAIGYDAYSILKTGRDHHGHWFPLVAFESFGDYKPALYFYTVSLAEAVFGLNIFSVRFPSVLAGVVIVFLSGKIVQELQRIFLKSDRKFQFWPELTMMVTAVNPWFLIFSRGGWEVNLATAFIMAGVYFGLKNWKQPFTEGKNSALLKNYLLSVLFFSLSMYAYHSARVVAPLLGILIAFPLLKSWKKFKGQIFILVFLLLILLTPILFSIRTPEFTQRLAETRAIPSVELVQKSNLLIQEDDSTRFAKLIHHRWLFYAQLIAGNILKHFDLTFLFLSGDVNPRHSIQFFGQLYHLDFLFLIVGSIAIWQKDKKIFLFLISWLFIAILPASLTTAVPHALRILPGAVVYPMIIAFGMLYSVYLIKKSNIKKLFILLIALFYIGEVFAFFHFYMKVYPKVYASEWQYGYEEMVNDIHTYQRPGEQIFVSRQLGRPAMYYWFYSKTDPREVQLEAKKHEIEGKNTFEDQGEFLQFQNTQFVSGLNGTERGLIATIPEDLEKFPESQLFSTVKDLQGKDVWVVFRN